MPTDWWRAITDEVLVPPVKDDADTEQASGDLIQIFGAGGIPLARSKQPGLGALDQWKLFGLMPGCLRTDRKRPEAAQTKDLLNLFRREHWDQCSHICSYYWPGRFDAWKTVRSETEPSKSAAPARCGGTRPDLEWLRGRPDGAPARGLCHSLRSSVQNRRPQRRAAGLFPVGCIYRCTNWSRSNRRSVHS